MFSPRRLAEIAAQNVPAALCTVVETQGSTPRKIGASMVVIADGSPLGRIEGTIGGGAVEHRVRQEAIATLRAGMARRVEVALTADLGMCCGGTMAFLIEALRERPPCLIFGAGHVGASIAHFAAGAGFEVWLADPREDQLAAASPPAGVHRVADYESEDLDRLPFGIDASVVVVTHDHQVDQRLTEQVLRREFRYAALVASRRKALLTRQRCLGRGIPAAVVERLDAPAGLAIGAETPAEIALSIVAAMVQARRQGEPPETTKAS